MSDGVKDAGTKGYKFLFWFVVIAMIVALMLYVYGYNSKFLPGS
ncbi:MAG: hypothetical protein ACI85O_001396 [Saprospiraceae bacterium]|jgi:hypothetical protein